MQFIQSTWLAEVSLKEKFPVHQQGHRVITAVEIHLRLPSYLRESERLYVRQSALDVFKRRFSNCEVLKSLLEELGLTDCTLSDFYISSEIKSNSQTIIYP